MRLCEVDHCEAQHMAKGYCRVHYARWKRHGDPNKTDPSGRGNHRGGSKHRGTPTESTRICSVCSNEKPIAEFEVPGKARVGYYMSFCKKCNYLKRRASRYNLTVEQMAQMIKESQGKCSICKQEVDVLYVDHDHNCCSYEDGKSSWQGCGKCHRGLICRGCNLGLGGFKDDTTTLAAAIEYLNHHLNMRR